MGNVGPIYGRSAQGDEMLQLFVVHKVCEGEPSTHGSGRFAGTGELGGG